MSEKFFIPTVDPENIPKHRGNQERNQKENSFSQYILTWWRGDAHTHSRESTRPTFGHFESMYDLAEIKAYYESLGLEFACITEHASDPSSPKILSPDNEICQSLLVEAENIEKLNKEKEGAFLLSGVEASILFDENGEAKLDVPDEVLAKLDLVIASRHAIEQQKEPEAIKQSLMAAINNPQVNVIGHPDRYTRHDKEKSKEYWSEYWAIWPEILSEMVKNNKAFEINLNAQPSKKLVKMAAEAGIKFFINFDAHDFNQYQKDNSEAGQQVNDAKMHWAKGIPTEGELEILGKYKNERLSQGPGVTPILRLAQWLKRLQQWKVKPDRVINSSSRNLLQFLVGSGKKTNNLTYHNK